MADIVLRVAAKGVIYHEGKILALREASTYEEGTNTGRWHLPGGRLEPGESYIDGLHREVREETGLEITEIGLPVYVGEWRPVIKGVPTQIVALFSICYVSSDKVQLSEEHDAYIWLDITKPINLDLMGPEPEVLARVKDFHAKGLL